MWQSAVWIRSRVQPHSLHSGAGETEPGLRFKESNVVISPKMQTATILCHQTNRHGHQMFGKGSRSDGRSVVAKSKAMWKSGIETKSRVQPHSLRSGASAAERDLRLTGRFADGIMTDSGWIRFVTSGWKILLTSVKKRAGFNSGTRPTGKQAYLNLTYAEDGFGLVEACDVRLNPAT